MLPNSSVQSSEDLDKLVDGAEGHEEVQELVVDDAKAGGRRILFPRTLKISYTGNTRPSRVCVIQE